VGLHFYSSNDGYDQAEGNGIQKESLFDRPTSSRRTEKADTVPDATIGLKSRQNLIRDKIRLAFQLLRQGFDMLIS
jgi:hypothetical protein